MLPALAELARAGGVLYDVGAHLGFFSCAWQVLGGDGVEAFEPVPRHQKLLHETFARNNLGQQVRLHPAALGHEDMIAQLRVNQADLGDSSLAYVEGMGGIDWRLRADAYPDAETLKIRVRRLDDVIGELPNPPAVLKIDVEGAEACVIEGARAVLSRHRPTILSEVHNVYAGMQMAESLERLGYRLQLLGKNHWLPACMWVPAEKTHHR
jgi:FkbM family methyltransferase